ncbi:MAG: hypothetical protein EOP85_09760 [Verrucomicrobiaceae bacterium]|nr:MAG: hypothetical protein EOP85_09760 [Verrucomicrobiaceae bacterium]
MIRYTVALIVILAACFGAQTVALRMSGGKTLKSESNYFSSVARLQTESQGQPRIMMLGSSMTGRLGDRAQRFDGVANLGCDGGSAVVTLRAIDRGQLPTAPLLVIETNSLAFELEHRGKEISAAIDDRWFQTGITVPNLGATARPTAFAYSWLMARKQGEGSTDARDTLPITTRPAVLDPTSAPELDGKSAALVDEVSAILKRLQARGINLLLVTLPPGIPADSPSGRIPRAIAAKSGVRWWDLTEGLPQGTVSLSDGLHLDGPSAQKVMLTLMRELELR